MEQNLLEASHLETIQLVGKTIGLDYLWVHITPLGASVRDMHRRDLRRSLIEYLNDKLKKREVPLKKDLATSLSELMALTDTDKIPDTSFANISMTHCPLAGGFAIADTNHKIGFDLEVSARVTAAPMGRISNHDEMFEAPDMASLWVAKESAFKSLYSNQQPRTLSEVKTFDWKLINENLYTFSFRPTHLENGPAGIGAVSNFNRLKMGIARV